MRRKQVQRGHAPPPRAAARRASSGAARELGRGAQADGRADARCGAARQEQRRPAPDMLYVAGLGFGDKKENRVKGLWPCTGPFDAFVRL